VRASKCHDFFKTICTQDQLDLAPQDQDHIFCPWGVLRPTHNV